MLYNQSSRFGKTDTWFTIQSKCLSTKCSEFQLSCIFVQKSACELAVGLLILEVRKEEEIAPDQYRLV